ncbi:hypothetical protein ACFSRY_18980 [Pontibacter locisalis]|uniref:Uncharacterized protein n=1 Tax=Pontibacter locisalis TaxID=1719035 RepID=A0ABW5IRD3_9BACT
MNPKKINAITLALAVTVTASFGLASCDKGTKPGETNVERSEIIEEGSLVGEEGESVNRYSDTANLEKYYDHADHEDHSDNEREAWGDGAYDGKGDGLQRDEVQ